MTPEGRRFASELVRKGRPYDFKVEARTECSCGCGKPKRVDLIAPVSPLSIIDPVTLDQLISCLKECRLKLWGTP